MARHPSLVPGSALGVGILLAVLGASGCGPAIPEHDGYSSSKTPWKKLKRVKWKDDNTARIEDTVSYPARKRARWYQVDLPGDGELTIKMEVVPEAQGEFKLGFEVMDAGYRSIMRMYDDEEFFPDKKGRVKKKKHAADDDEGDDAEDGDDEEGEDEGDDDDDDDDDDGPASEESGDDLEWERTLLELRKGTYYLHVYTTGRLDVAEYSMKITYKPANLDHRSNFPSQVAFYDPLPIVPVTDDTPQLDCKSCDCKTDPRCKLSCDRCDKKSGGHHVSRPSVDCDACDCNDSACKKKCKAKCTTTATCVGARILRPMSSGGGTKLVLSAGSLQGVAVGWKGRVVDGKGKGIEGGDFTVSNAGSNTSEGTVRTTPDAVRAAGGVRICPP